MSRTLIKDTVQKIGEKIEVMGWINTRRDHGKIVFIDLRDRSGILQTVLTKDLAGDVGNEDVIKLSGEIKKRPESWLIPK